LTKGSIGLGKLEHHLVLGHARAPLGAWILAKGSIGYGSPTAGGGVEII